MESVYEVEDEFREIIIRYADTCKDRGLDPVEQINNLVAEELKNI
jgi:hypothetical protein